MQKAKVKKANFNMIRKADEKVGHQATAMQIIRTGIKFVV